MFGAFFAPLKETSRLGRWGRRVKVTGSNSVNVFLGIGDLDGLKLGVFEIGDPEGFYRCLQLFKQQKLLSLQSWDFCHLRHALALSLLLLVPAGGELPELVLESCSLGCRTPAKRLTSEGWNMFKPIVKKWKFIFWPSPPFGLSDGCSSLPGGLVWFTSTFLENGLFCLTRIRMHVSII